MSETPGAFTDVVDVGDYVAIAKRRKWVIVAVAAVMCALAAAFVVSQEPLYESTTTVLVRPITRDPLDSFESPSKLLDLTTEAKIVTSTSVASRAQERLETRDPVSELADRVTVEAPAESQLLVISYVSNDPRAAAAGAAAFADAYLDFRGRRAAETLASSIESLQQRLQALNEQLEESNATITRLARSPNDPQYLEAQSQRTLLSNQIALLSSNLAERLGVDVDAGEIIGPAEAPEAPTSPKPLRTMVIALAAGVVLGVAVAFVVERLDDRVNVASDVEQALGVPVVGSVRARRRFSLRQDLSPPATDAYRRVAIAVEGHAADTCPFVLMVASGRELPECTDTVMNVGVALSRDHRVLILDGARRPGGPQSLDGASASITANGRPIVHLREQLDLFIDAGDDDDDDRGLTGVGFHSLLARVGKYYDYILVDVPPVLTNADALELHDVAKHVLVVARLRTTSTAELQEMRAQLATFGMAPVGAVVHAATRRTRHRVRRPSDGVDRYERLHVPEQSHPKAAQDVRVAPDPAPGDPVAQQESQS